jgi:hypothetical protein
LSKADLLDSCLILVMASPAIMVGAIKSLKLNYLTRLQQETNIGNQHEKITDESYIIRDKFATFSKYTNRSKPAAEYAIDKQMKFLLRKAGLPYEQLQPDHSFRKFFNTCLMNSNIAF